MRTVYVQELMRLPLGKQGETGRRGKRMGKSCRNNFNRDC